MLITMMVRNFRNHMQTHGDSILVRVAAAHTFKLAMKQGGITVALVEVGLRIVILPSRAAVSASLHNGRVHSFCSFMRSLCSLLLLAPLYYCHVYCRSCALASACSLHFEHLVSTELCADSMDVSQVTVLVYDLDQTHQMAISLRLLCWCALDMDQDGCEHRTFWEALAIVSLCARRVASKSAAVF